SGIAGQRNQMDHIQLVGDIFVPVEGPVLWVAKVKRNGVPSANRLKQLKNEETGGVSGCAGRSEFAGGNCNSRDRQLFSGIRILDEDGSPKCNRPLPLDQRPDAGSKQEADKQG